MRKNILNLLIFLHAVTANAQTLNMRYDDSYNICHVNAIVDNVLLEVLGEKRIEEWLTTDKLKLLMSEYYKRYGDYDFFVWMCINRIMELNEVIK